MFVRETKALIKDRLLMRNIFHPFIPLRRTFPIFGSGLSGFGRNCEDKDIHMAHTHTQHAYHNTCTFVRGGFAVIECKFHTCYNFLSKFPLDAVFLRRRCILIALHLYFTSNMIYKSSLRHRWSDQVRDGLAWDRLLSYPQNTNFMTVILA